MCCVSSRVLASTHFSLTTTPLSNALRSQRTQPHAQALSPQACAEIIRSGRLSNLAVATALSMMEARDAAAALDALEALAGAEVQALVLSRLPRPFRRTMLSALGRSLCARLSRGAVSAASSGAKVPTALALARALASRCPAIAASVVASLDSRPAWAVLSAMRPQVRAQREPR